MTYWKQFTYNELKSMQGVEDDGHADDIDISDTVDTDVEEIECCSRCRGRGCDYCLL